MSDTESTTDSTESEAMRGPSEHDPIDLYEQLRHRNGDETVVLLTEFGSGYQAIAIDITAGGQVIETEVIGDSQEREKAVGMVEYWLDQNPDGVWGATEGGGFLEKLGLGGGGT